MKYRFVVLLSLFLVLFACSTKDSHTHPISILTRDGYGGRAFVSYEVRVSKTDYPIPTDRKTYDLNTDIDPLIRVMVGRLLLNYSHDEISSLIEDGSMVSKLNDGISGIDIPKRYKVEIVGVELDL